MLERLPSTFRTREQFAALFDHTLLKPDATPKAVRALCAEAKEHGFKGVCVNPCYMALTARELTGTPQLPIAVVGFPLGANRTDIKIDETLRAIADGAREIDMVVNLGMYLGGEHSACRHDIQAVVRSAGPVPVKVILETAFLNSAQITELCQWCVDAGAAQVKTSTGFGPRGASVEDIQTMAKATAASPVAIKASGGIRTLEQVVDLVAAGATRIGASASVQILQAFATLLR